MRNTLTIFFVAAMLTPMLSQAQTPSTQPSPDSNIAPSNELRRPWRDRMQFRGPWRRDTFTDEEWQVASQFLQDMFPKRWELFEIVAEKRQQEAVSYQRKLAIVNRYRQLQRMQRDNPDLYDAALDHAKAEEDVFGAARAARSTPDDPKAKAALRDEARKLVEHTFSERQARLQTLRQMIEREEKQLAEDRKSADKMIQNQVERLLSDNPFRGPDSVMSPSGPGSGPGARPFMPRDEGRPQRDNSPQ